MYITFTEYKDLGGTLTEPAFNSLVYDAQTKLDYNTFGRLKKDTSTSEAVKRCIVKILELLNTHSEYIKAVTDINSPVMSSQSNDGVSVSYGGYLGNTTPSDIDTITKKLDVDIKKVIQEYLVDEKNQAGQVLLYRGVYR